MKWFVSFSHSKSAKWNERFGGTLFPAFFFFFLPLLFGAVGSNSRCERGNQIRVSCVDLFSLWSRSRYIDRLAVALDKCCVCCWRVRVQHKESAIETKRRRQIFVMSGHISGLSRIEDHIDTRLKWEKVYTAYAILPFVWWFRLHFPLFFSSLFSPFQQEFLCLQTSEIHKKQTVKRDGLLHRSDKWHTIEQTWMTKIIYDSWLFLSYQCPASSF